MKDQMKVNTSINMSMNEKVKAHSKILTGLENSFTEQSSEFQSKQNSMMFFVPTESRMVHKLGNESYGLNFRGTNHSKEHILYLEKLGKEGKMFNDHVKDFKKKMKGLIKKHRIIGKSLLAGYQITTLSHLIISLMEKQENFTEDTPKEFIYSINRRKINLNYFQKRPNVRKIAEYWETNLLQPQSTQ
jgi:hypothetical protein